MSWRTSSLPTVPQAPVTSTLFSVKNEFIIFLFYLVSLIHKVFFLCFFLWSLRYSNKKDRINIKKNPVTNVNKTLSFVLGLIGYAKTAFQKAINQPQGMVILTGPTGSGKTTTLYSALDLLRSPERNILTIEDPIEFMFHQKWCASLK